MVMCWQLGSCDEMSLGRERSCGEVEEELDAMLSC